MISGDPWSKHKRGWKRWKSGSIHESWWIMVNDYESSQACSASQRVRFYANPSTQPGSPGSMIQRPTARSYQRRAWSDGSGSGPQTNWHPIQLVIWNLQSNMWLQATWVCSFWIYIYIYMHIYRQQIYLFMNGILEWGLKTFFCQTTGYSISYKLNLVHRGHPESG